MWAPPKTSFVCGDVTTQDKQEQSEDEEDDYMSDAFLNRCTDTTNDIRPGITMSRTAKRAIEVDNKKLEQKRVRRVRKHPILSQRERLTEGLNTAIGTENKGFAMLQKMGYTPGTSLGKGGSGLLEPVSVEVKQDRLGLGLKRLLDERKREKVQSYFERVRRQITDFDPEKYREQKRLEMEAKRLEADLHKCRRCCYRLDQEQGHTEPMQWYLWPSHLLPAQEEVSHENCHEDCNGDCRDDFEDQKQNSEIVSSTSNTLSKQVPVDDYDEEIGSNYNVCEEKPSTEEMKPWQIELYLDLASTYLRQAYCYCFWCGTVYTGLEDMEESCPGTTRQDHDD